MAKVVKSIKEQIAELENQKAALLAQQDEQNKQAENKLNGHIDGIAADMSKILGRELNLGEALNLIKRRMDGKSLFSVDNGGDKGRRLSETEHKDCRQLMLDRGLALKSGKTPMQISAIADKFKVSALTVSKRAPSVAELEAGKLIDEPAAPAATPAPAGA